MLLALVHCTVTNTFRGTPNSKPPWLGQQLKFKQQHQRRINDHSASPEISHCREVQGSLLSTTAQYLL